MPLIKEAQSLEYREVRQFDSYINQAWALTQLNRPDEAEALLKHLPEQALVTDPAGALTPLAPLSPRRGGKRQRKSRSGSPSPRGEGVGG